VFQPFGSASPEDREYQSDLNDLYAAQEGIFRRGQQNGQFRHTLDPRLLAVTYQGAVDSMLGYLDAYPETDAELANTVAEVLLGGVADPTRQSIAGTGTDHKLRT
jgi:hypothetical protein